MSGAWHRAKSKNGLLRLEELSNRINYLANKNQKTNKNMKTLLGWFHDKQSTQKPNETNLESKNVINQKTFRIKQAKTHKSTNQLIPNSCMRFQRQEKKENVRKQRLESEQSQQKTIKRQKIDPKIIKNQIKNINVLEPPNFVILKPQIRKKKTQQSPRQAKFQFRNLTNMSNDTSMKRLIRDNCQTNRSKEKQSQQFKLLEIKKKLLQEEQRSLIQYEKCILYKQKMVQKLKSQQQQKKEELRINQRKNSDIRMVDIEQIQ